MTQQNPERSDIGKEERSTHTSKYPTTPRRHTTKKVEIPTEVVSPNLPPRKKKSEVLVLKHYRLRSIDVRQTEAVVDQRNTDPNDVVRRQYERGVNVDTALGAPGEDGLYGLYRGQRLAEVLRPDIDGLISFALNQGVIPTVIQEYRGIIQGLNDTMQGLRSQLAALPMAPPVFSTADAQQQEFEAVTEIADEADGILGMFFGGSEENDGVVEGNGFLSS